MLLQLLNLVNIGGTAVMAGVQALAGITVHAEESYNYTPELEVAREFRGKHHWMNEDAKRCRFTGVMVPFSRDWEERTTNNEGLDQVSAPMPEKMVGHAFILNKRICLDVPPENIFRLATAPRSLGFQRVVEGSPLTTYNLHDMNPGQLPLWAPQVLNRLERLANEPATASDVKLFVAETKPEFSKIRNMLVGGEKINLENSD